ncbi:MAG: hypothetical protein WCV41_02725 [Patescibacteria group bacterium]
MTTSRTSRKKRVAKKTVSHPQLCNYWLLPDPKALEQAFDKFVANKERFHRIIFGNKDLVEY